MDTLTWFAFGGITILIVFIAIDVFHGGDAATGYLNAAIGIGGTVGALFSGALVLRPRLGPVLLVGGAITAAAVVVLGAANLIVVAFAAIAVASAGNLILDVTRTTMFQRVVPDAYRGRFSGLLLTTQSVVGSGWHAARPHPRDRVRVRLGHGPRRRGRGRGDGDRGPADRRGGRRARGPLRRRPQPDRPPAAVRRPVARPRGRCAATRCSRWPWPRRRRHRPPGRPGRPVLRDRRRLVLGVPGRRRGRAVAGAADARASTTSSASAGSSPVRLAPRPSRRRPTACCS